MVIQHNIQAMIGNNNMQALKKCVNKSTKKLSSGYKINSSADDAAGLAISEKMRGQIRGLRRGRENMEDGISLVQIADGGLSETHAILQRMRELSVQAANDTNQESDRKAIQEEITQLAMQIDTIANTTQFNSDIYPLARGRMEGKSKPDSSYSSSLGNVSLNGAGAIMIFAKEDPAHFIGSMGTFGARVKITSGTDILDLDFGKSTSSIGIKEKTGNKVIYEYNNAAKNIHFTIEQTFDIKKVDGSSRGGEYCDMHYKFNNLGTGNLGYNIMLQMDPLHGDMADAPSLDGTVMSGGQLVQFGSGAGEGTMICNPDSFPNLNCDVTAIVTGNNIINTPTSAYYGHMTHTNNNLPSWDIMNGTVPVPTPGNINYHYSVAWMNKTVAAGSSYEVNTMYGVSYPMIASGGSGNGGDLWIQGGSNCGQGFYIPLVDATAKTLGVNNLDLTTHDGAVDALTSLDNAIDTASAYRGQFGAYQNRMEHAIRDAANKEENLQSAESLLRDTNLADEMVNFSKNNILMQATQSVLANSNKNPESILNILN